MINQREIYEASNLAQRQAEVQRTCNALTVRIAAMNRDDAELAVQLQQALSQGKNPGPILKESADLHRERARLLADIAEKTLIWKCLAEQTSELLGKIASQLAFV